jgi:hypothetical protein
MDDNDREYLPILLGIQSRRFTVEAIHGWSVLDTETGTIVERNQYRQDAEYIARRLNAGLNYVPGGHFGPPKE